MSQARERPIQTLKAGKVAGVREWGGGGAGGGAKPGLGPGGEPKGGAGGGWLGLTTLGLLNPAKPDPLWLLSAG